MLKDANFYLLKGVIIYMLYVIRRRKLLDDLKERRGYFHLKEEALDRTMWRARFGRSFGPVVRQTTK
jgi:hypothetical protein